MAVPAAIFVVCFGGGVWASTRWLPGLARGPVGDIAFFAICGLIGAGVGVVGLHVYETARAISEASGLARFEDKANLLAGGLLDLLLDGGTVLGLATIAYLLAPREEQPAQSSTHAHVE